VEGVASLAVLADAAATFYVAETKTVTAIVHLVKFLLGSILEGWNVTF